MKNLGSFHSYQPGKPEFPGANYICNDEGVDWYAIAWDEERIAGNVYVGVDSSGCILSATDDGSKLFPVNMTVWEMSKSEMPTGLLDDWSLTTLTDGKFSINYNAKAESQRQSLLNAANDTIADWKIELQLETISDDDKVSLIAWMAYIKALKALDLTSVKDEVAYNGTEWPVEPE
jgi:hypothetical protein